MFGIAGAAAVSAANANPRIDLESRRSIRINQLQRCRALPGLPISAWIGVNAVGSPEVLRIHHDREARQRLQIVLNRAAPLRIVHDIRIHPIVHDLTRRGKRPLRPLHAANVRRLPVGRLRDHVAQEDVCLGIDVGGDVGRQERRRPNRHRLVDEDGAAVNRSAGRRRRGSVQRIANLRPRRGRRDGQVEGRTIKPAACVELGILHHPLERRGAVGGSRRGRREITLVGRGDLDAFQLRINQKILIARRKIQSLDRQHVHPRAQRAQRNVDVLIAERLRLGMLRRSRGIPRHRRRRVPPRHFRAVHIRHEAVVILHPQPQDVVVSRILHREIQAHERRRVVIQHLRLGVGVDQAQIIGRRRARGGFHRPSRQYRIAHQHEIRIECLRPRRHRRP